MSKQQDTEDIEYVLLHYFGKTPKVEEALRAITSKVAQQKAEAADQAVRDFAAELERELRLDSASWDESTGPGVVRMVLQQFLGKGKV
jgi:hypothetical protein